MRVMTIAPTPTTHVTVDLLAWHESGALELSPKFQRRPVWKPASKGYFIDSLLRGYPIPPIHIRLGMSKAGTASREIIDGQQRLRAVFDFIAGKFRLSKSLDGPWAGRSFSELDEDDANRLRMYKFHAFQYDAIDDATVLEIFARINTYSVALNKQELRNGQYFGEFKNAMYELARTHLPFWRDARLFTETSIARMAEVELVSELSALILDGVQDKKASLDSFYRALDEEWGATPIGWSYRRRQLPAKYIPRVDLVVTFNQIVDHVVDVAGDMIATTEFRRVPLFYSLFAVVAHHLYGLPGVQLPTPRRRLSDDETLSLRDALGRLSQIVSDKESPDSLPVWQRDYLIASSRQTDNLAPRMTRINTLWSQAGLGQ